MKHLFSLTLLLTFALFTTTFSQTWVDTLYQIQTVTDISYGMATDVAGNQRDLLMDISVPANDTPPACGRPLLIAVHGGAFISGNKGGDLPPRLRVDFAKRGFTTASINYRLGQLQTNSSVHCNISSLFNVEWDCLNMTDTSEWYRAYYRGIQDLNGAIRFLVNHADDYDIDPNNIFIVGESAGAFLAMGVGYLNDPGEVLPTLSGTMPDAPAPNAIYEGQCVQKYNVDTTIASMDLSRPDLGSFTGNLNQPAATPYRIRGIGNFYGGVFNNIFLNGGSDQPALYLFHQPADLIVPNRKNRVLAGFAYCATQFPFNCQYIINRPFVWGGQGIVDMLNANAMNGDTVPDHLIEITSNNANCAQQIANPGVGGHQPDNYWLRTTNMATFFAPKIDSCSAMTSVDNLSQADDWVVYPNPTRGILYVENEKISHQDVRIEVLDIHGKRVGEFYAQLSDEISIELPAISGLYFLKISGEDETSIKKVIVR